jgi:peroxiredoxin
MKKILILLIIFSFTAQGQVKIGENMPAFTLLDANNKKVSSSSFNQKYILVDFWASWCAPCRLGNKKLVQLYKTVDKNKLEIIGISLDTDKLKWNNAIKKDKIEFTQLIDPNGFDAKTAIQFGVEEIPSKFIFNEKGILIAINPTDEEIIKYFK